MGEFEATLDEHLGHIAQAQLIAQSLEDDQQDDVSRNLQMIEGSTGAPVEAPFAG